VGEGLKYEIEDGGVEKRDRMRKKMGETPTRRGRERDKTERQTKG
jgi:hypothetical protein